MEGSSATIFSLLLLILALVPISSANVFYAGGKDGWVLKPSEDYSSWAGRNRFQVNDSLVFKYKKGENSVLLVTKQDYESCNVKNPLQKLDGGDSVFKFDRSGPFYFISGEPGLCSSGQKLNVVVLAVRNTKPISPPPPTAEPPTSPPVPSPAVNVPSPSPSTHHSSPSTSPSASPMSSPPSPSASPISSPPSPSPSVNVPSPSPSSVLPPSPSPSAPQSSPSISPSQEPTASPPVSGPSPSNGSSQPPSSSSPPSNGSSQPPSSSSPPSNGPGSGSSSGPGGSPPSSSSTVLTVSSRVFIGVVALVLGGAFLC